MLKCENLYKSFNKQIVLKNINLEIKKGQITVLIGRSGVGKTTMIRAVSVLDPPDEGKITIDENIYNFPSIEQITPWPKITVVFQQLFLWPHLRLIDNIKLPLRNNKYDGADELLKELIEKFDMKDFINRFPNETSLGQRQRAALVRALVLNPSYLLLDEITSALDVQNINIVLNHLIDLKNKNVGILIVTHLIGFARLAADQIIIIDDGEILEIGGKEILDSTKNPKVREFLSMH